MGTASRSSSRGGRGASPFVSSTYRASAASIPLFIAVWDPYERRRDAEYVRGIYDVMQHR